jgi:hypothetical protein
MITRQGSIRGLVNNIRRERERQLGAASEVIDAVMEMWSDGDATGHAGRPAGPTSEIETISPFFPPSSDENQQIYPASSLVNKRIRPFITQKFNHTKVPHKTQF